MWPGAVVLGGEIRGIWRRTKELLTARMWKFPSAAGREAVESEAVALPLPGVEPAAIRES